MKLVVSNPNSLQRYIPECCKASPPSEQSVILIRKLPRQVRDEIADQSLEFEGMGISRMLSATTATKLLVASLAGWERVVDENGSEVEFRADAKAAMLDLLPLEIQEELLSVVNPKREERK